MVDAADDKDLDDAVDPDLQDDTGGEEGKQPGAGMSEIEIRARKLGWVSEADWDDERAEREGRRKPAKFISAEEFIERTESSIPIMRERLHTIEQQNSELKSKLDDVHGVVMWQRERSKVAVQNAYKQGREAAEQAMRDAVVEGDTDKYDAAKEKLAELDANAPVVEEERRTEPAKPAANPVAVAWVQQNPWFNSDGVLSNAMIAEESEVKRANPELPLYEVLEKAKRMVMKRYPERFNINPRREAPSTVSSPSGARQTDGNKSFDSIPKADREAFERQRKMMEAKGVKYTREEFMADYAL